MPREFLVYSVLQAFVAVLYGIDKYKATVRSRRIPEKVLLFWTMLAPFGAYIGIFVFRHKTKKWYFLATAVVFMFVHFGLYFLYQKGML